MMKIRITKVRMGRLLLLPALFCTTLSLRAQYAPDYLDGTHPRMEYEYSVSTKTTIFRDSVGAMSINIANRYAFSERAMLGVQVSPVFFSYYSDKAEDFYVKDNDVFLPVMVSFRYDILPRGKMSPYFVVNAGGGLFFSDAERIEWTGGAYVGFDFFRTRIIGLFVELGVEYGRIGLYTPLKVGFRLR